MGPDSNSNSSRAASASTPTASPNGKRARDPEDEVYVDNLHSHKRYLSEIMASSLNGLTVGDPLSENLMGSLARSENMFYANIRDEMSMQYSPMSEDSEDSRFSETPVTTCSSQPDSRSTSPVSPYRYQRPFSAFGSTSSYTAHGTTATSVSCSQSRQRGSDSEGRFPSSPSDICHSADLRRTALLRSVQMRTQPYGTSSFELSFGSEQEPVLSTVAEEHPCSYMKSLVDERDYHIECSSVSPSESQFHDGESCRVLNMKDEPGG